MESIRHLHDRLRYPASENRKSNHRAHRRVIIRKSHVAAEEKASAVNEALQGSDHRLWNIGNPVELLMCLDHVCNPLVALLALHAIKRQRLDRLYAIDGFHLMPSHCLFGVHHFSVESTECW